MCEPIRRLHFADEHGVDAVLQSDQTARHLSTQRVADRLSGPEVEMWSSDSYNDRLSGPEVEMWSSHSYNDRPDHPAHLNIPPHLNYVAKLPREISTFKKLPCSRTNSNKLPCKTWSLKTLFKIFTI